MLFNKCAISLQTKNTLELALLVGMDVDSIRSKQGRTLLMYAAEYGSVSDVELLLAMGADVNAEDNFAWTPLLLACQHGYKKVAEILLEAGANASVKTKGGVSPLYFASSRGHVGVVQLLLSIGITPDPESLHSALGHRYTNCASLLVDAGVDVNVPNDRGWTPLLIASNLGFVDIVESLLNAGADTNYINKQDLTPLRVACAKGHVEIAKTLVSFGAVKDVVAYGTHMTRFDLDLCDSTSHSAQYKFDWTTYNRNAKYEEILCNSWKNT